MFGTLTDADPSQRLFFRGRPMRLISLVAQSSLADAPAIIHTFLARLGSEEALRGDPYPSRVAIVCGRYDVAHIMLNYIMDSDVGDPSSGLAQLKLLFDVARHNPFMQPIVKLAMVSRLVELEPGQLRQRDANRRLPIHEFCRHPLRSEAAQEKLIDLLVRRGFTYTLNTTDTAGATPLQLAASRPNANGLLRGLLRHGADLWSAGVPRGSRLGRLAWMPTNASLTPTNDGIMKEIKMEIAGYMCNAIPPYLLAPLWHRISQIIRLFITTALERTTAATPRERVDVFKMRFGFAASHCADREMKLTLQELVEVAFREEAA
ncbi:unnamed protein product [Vitrella brassicaformis CCMP3155]|uniref:Uncharacterized protein n=1 Tax=Vitrella brassicaformis (strain CCMP3155) TaxID=1169540 RepID=A0A0G4EQ34_VITBC|nr:unnamed protein product [Vitrella brassicaformis CCMP3155]|eukprot:CEL99512.1 unnamed protein product [Vitrella brassicaformis CCMP3155]